jgi:hypothetical protein
MLNPAGAHRPNPCGSNTEGRRAPEEQQPLCQKTHPYYSYAWCMPEQNHRLEDVMKSLNPIRTQGATGIPSSQKIIKQTRPREEQHHCAN